MKRTISLTIALAISIGIFAQPDLVWGTPMQYKLNLLRVDGESNNDYQYERGESKAFTKLYPPEMRVISEGFLHYVKTIRSVKNYVSPLGTMPPTTIGDMTIEQAMKGINNGNLERVGNMYFDKTKCTDEISYSNGNILKNGKPLIENDELKLGFDSVYTENLNTGDMELVVTDLSASYFQEASTVQFIEEWEYDKMKGRFEKDIKYNGLMVNSYDTETGEVRGYKSLFTFKAGKFNKKMLGRDGLIKENMEYNVLFNLDFNSDEDEFSYGMARTSFAHGYIEPTERYDLLYSLLADVKSGKLSVYHFDPLTFNPSRLKPASANEFLSAMHLTDTVMAEDLLTGKMTERVVHIDYTFSDVVGIHFIEDWFMDAENMAIYKRVKGIVLLREVKDEDTGLPKGVKAISPFYIKLNPRL